MIDIICSIALTLLIWFNTDAVEEYLTIIIPLTDYKQKKKEDVRLNLIEYLRQYHNNFLTRLVTCPICLSIWLTTFVSIIIPTIFPNICIIVVASLFIYGILNKLF